MKEKLRPLIDTVRDFTSRMGERRLPIYATSGCYYLFMSLVPIAMIFCCILPYTPFRQQIILTYVDQYFAESLGDILRQIVNAVYNSNASTLTVSILLTLYSASASMKALMNGMDAAYHCKKKDNFIVFTLRALIYMVLLVATLLMALVIMVFGGRILLLLRRYFSSVGFLSFILSKGRYFLVMLILFLVFTALYKLMPAEKVRFRDQIPGAVFSSLVWVVFSSVFTLYVEISDKYGAYGVIGTVMVTMMWGYYCLYFLLIGGFLNSYLTDCRKAETVSALPEENSASPENASVSSEYDSPLAGEGTSPEESDTTVRDSAAVSMAAEPVGNGPEPSDKSGKSQNGKKKLPVPLIAGAGAAAAALFAALLLFLKSKKKKKKKQN